MDTSICSIDCSDFSFLSQMMFMSAPIYLHACFPEYNHLSHPRTCGNNILIFFSIYPSIGRVHLPLKCNYFTTDDSVCLMLIDRVLKCASKPSHIKALTKAFSDVHGSKSMFFVFSNFTVTTHQRLYPSFVFLIKNQLPRLHQCI